MSVLRGVAAAVIEWLPLVRLADVTDDGENEIVVGPKPSSTLATVLRHAGDRSVQFGPVVLTMGAE
ncbi:MULTISPECIES: hypothetical protein [Natrinema]|uniref:Uncharacterized protein n=1 Tax=Natrinema gari JCM 14663 TaxID=1230459 RepID=L9ZBR6_9EURY|nr:MULTISPECIES: hypothetical protein [Natrinema]AFO57026.1 hypothetical protein NJ7G_1783 [Natrinema sp. J7-2]ELY83456.1 hypothetical protein C486_02303 [Natrinema gari JCM 14663]